ncbi:MAG: HEPN domain-containing protein [Candidatus Micrarchaeota archaeon]
MKEERSEFVLRKCFEGSLESPARLLKREPSTGTAGQHLDKAHKNLAAMSDLREKKHYDWVAIAGYYSMYHSVMASLYLIGLEARTHECALLAFDSFYLKKGRVPKEYLKFVQRARKLNDQFSETLEHARTTRIAASYSLSEIRSPEAEKVATNAKAFYEEILRLLYEAKGSAYTRVKS